MHSSVDPANLMEDITAIYYSSMIFIYEATWFWSQTFEQT